MENAAYWKQVQDLLNEAAERAPQERERFLQSISDPAIRKEVSSLLSCHQDLSDEPIEQGVLNAARNWASAPKSDDLGWQDNASWLQSRFQPGETVTDRYRIVALLAAGGMGEVYWAQDLKLMQPVALKFLPQVAASDEGRRKRLHAEVRIARQVSHPNVCRVYDIGEVDGCPYISMEYVDGEDLSSLLRRIGRLPADKALDFARKIAAGLAAIHEKGVLHRDLKPANIMVDARGEVLITDFGLAGPIGKINGREVQNGTPAYMAPEQIAGGSVSVRSDIYSLGLVMYEMLTGKRAFEDGARNHPPSKISNFVRDIHPEVERVVRRCLAANPEERPPTALAVVASLPSAKIAPIKAEPLSSIYAEREKNNVSRRAVMIWLASMSVGLAVLAFLLHRRYAGAISSPAWLTSSQNSWRAPRETPVTRYDGYEFQPSISPNGSEVAFVWNGTPGNYDVYVKPLDSEYPLRLTTNPAQDLHPSWSPDGHAIAFLRLYPDHRKEVFTISALGGSEHFVYRTHASRPLWTQDASALGDRFPGPAWSPDGKFIAISDRLLDSDPDSVFLVPLASGKRRQLTWPAHGDVGDYMPCFSPDGEKLAFVRMSSLESGSDIYVQPLSGTGGAKRITFDNVAIGGLTWLSSEELVFPSDHQDGPRLWSINIHRGGPTEIPGVRGEAGDLSASRDGHLIVYSQSFHNTNVWRAPVNRGRSAGGDPVRLIASSTKNDSAEYSPNGSRIVFVSDRSGQPEIWTAMADGSNLVAVAFPKGRSIGTPRWSPDGQTIAFDTDLNRHAAIETISTSGGEAKVFVADRACEDMMPSWSRDGQYIYYSVACGGTGLQIWKKSVNGGNPFQITQHDGGDRAESPDGKILYYDRRPGVWQVPVWGGQEEPVPGLADVPTERLFWIGRSGIYYSSTKDSSWNVYFLNLRNKQRSRVGTIQRSPEFWTPSLSVSPDERWMLYSQTDQSGADLMMLQDFH